jgi:hypothetical protein
MDSGSADSILKENFPWSTPAERKRFLKARKGNVQAAVDQLWLHQKWLIAHDLMNSDGVDSDVLNSDMCDLDLWNGAVVDTWLIPLYNPSKTMKGVLLPRIIRQHCTHEKKLKTKDGKRIIQCLPAQIDWSLASIDTYTAALALYLYKMLDRYSEEKIVLLIDVRAGWGWKNPPAWDFVSFVKNLTKVLERNFPERLDMCIVYPLPWGMESIWKLVRPFIDRDTANKIRLISGPASRISPPPNDTLAIYMDDDTLMRLEENRTSSFTMLVHTNKI